MPDAVLAEVKALRERGASQDYIDGLLKFLREDAVASEPQVVEALRQVRWAHPSGERR